MPDPWDRRNIPHNLAILARFSANRSDKLSVDTSTGRFGFQGQGALTSMKRFFTIGESLANIYYLNALRNLFQESLRFVGDRTGSGGVTPQDIRGAWQGLRNICDTYSGEKRFKLLSLVKEITDTLPASCVDEASPRRIREH